jgi:5-methylcytosine-specific restriction endonuclease McrA
MDSVPVILLLFALSSCCYQPSMRPSLDTAEPVGVTGETVASEPPEYDRSEWGRWIDEDNDCQDTRQEVLIDESLDPVTLDERGCKVLTGRWLCSYTGKTFTDPSLLDIDHIVPLREVHVSGGWRWSSEMKSEYFNHMGSPLVLTAVDRSANRSKGARTPAEWLPAVPGERCSYLKIWVMVKRQWGLDMTCSESEAVARLMADHCP